MGNERKNLKTCFHQVLEERINFSVIPYSQTNWKKKFQKFKKSQFFSPLAAFQIKIFLKEWIWELASLSYIEWCIKKGLEMTHSFPRTVFLMSISEIKRALNGRHSHDSTTKQNFTNKFIRAFKGCVRYFLKIHSTSDLIT